jgi:lipoprotein-anchoring transpeptidase ErfK/SrfK
MLHSRLLALALFALFPAGQAMAKSEVTSTSSGTTTYFGAKSGEAAKGAEASQPAKEAQPKPVHLKPTVVASINLASQTMSVSVNGEPRYTWAISSGVAKHPTPRGTFHPQWTSKMWYSRKYDNAPMPHAVFIHGGIAIHGTYHTRSLGRPASHGCIRLSTAHAKTFYNLVQKHGMKRTKVSVYGNPPWRAPAIASDRPSRDRDYAENNSGGGGFWGNFFGGNDYYEPPRERRRVQRRRGGDYAYERRPRNRAYGYGYGSYYDGY